MAVSHYPSVYLDSNVFSYLHYGGGDVMIVAKRIMTRDWWDNERRYFRLFSSVMTMKELEAGLYRAQEAAIAENRRLVFLVPTMKVKTMAHLYLDNDLTPPNKSGDAFQLAFASCHGIDYLLSWNHAHLAKPETQTKLFGINKRFGYRTPLLVTPETIPKARLGQDIKRKDR